MPQNTIYYSTEANAKHWHNVCPGSEQVGVDCGRACGQGVTHTMLLYVMASASCSQSSTVGLLGSKFK